MKKCLSIILTCVLLISLSACGDEPVDSGISSDMSDTQTDRYDNSNTSAESKEDSNVIDSHSSTKKPGSQTTSGSTKKNNLTSSGGDSNSNNDNSDSSNNNNNNSQSGNDTPDTTEPISFTVDTSRATGTDFGSIVDNGYVYYYNPSTSLPGHLYRKKITGGAEEIVVESLSFDRFQVLDGKVYYLSSQGVYSCNGDGSNKKQLYKSLYKNGETITDFRVAGQWMLVLTQKMTNKTECRLLMLRLDGSKEYIVQPNIPKDSAARIFAILFHGYNRGYAYFSFEFTYTDGPKKNQSGQNTLQIDCRSKTPLVQFMGDYESVLCSYGGRNYTYKMFDMKDFYYDYANHQFNSDPVFISLSQKTASSINGPEKKTANICRLKKYLVHLNENSQNRSCTITFSGTDGTKKTVTLTDNGTDYCHYSLYYLQDVHNDGVVVMKETGPGMYCTLMMVMPNGTVYEIYSKNALPNK